MDPIALLAIAALCLSIPFLAWTAIAASGSVHRRAVTNLRRGLHSTVAADSSRTERLRQFSRRVASRTMTGRLDRLLAQAGRPAAWPLDRVLAVKFLGTLVAAGFAILLVLSTRTINGLLLALGGTILVFFLPEILLYNTALKRREAIGLALPDTLDQMSIAVEAGLGFDAAMIRVARNGKGPLAEELVRTMQDIQVGKTRRDSYEDLAQRTGVPSLKHFTRSIIQAETYGIALADVLNTQANEMRLQRRQRAEQKAMEIPVKVVFPLILCILPVLFIVILGPAVISIMNSFLGNG